MRKSQSAINPLSFSRGSWHEENPAPTPAGTGKETPCPEFPTKALITLLGWHWVPQTQLYPQFRDQSNHIHCWSKLRDGEEWDGSVPGTPAAVGSPAGISGHKQSAGSIPSLPSFPYPESEPTESSTGICWLEKPIMLLKQIHLKLK